MRILSVTKPVGQVFIAIFQGHFSSVSASARASFGNIQLYTINGFITVADTHSQNIPLRKLLQKHIVKQAFYENNTVHPSEADDGGNFLSFLVQIYHTCLTNRMQPSSGFQSVYLGHSMKTNAVIVIRKLRDALQTSQIIS